MTITRVLVSGTVFQPDDVTPCTGTAVFTPGDGVIIDGDSKHILAGEVTAALANGIVTTHLPPTDLPGTQPEPNTWNWTVRFKLNEAVIPPFSFALPYTADTVDLSEVARLEPASGTYTVIPGPEGPRGPKGDKGDPGTGGGTDWALLAVNNLTDLASASAARSALGLGTAATQPAGAFDAAGAATAAGSAAVSVAASDATGKASTAQAAAISAASADATSKVATHTSASDPHGDRAAAAADATTKAGTAQSNATTAAAADAAAKVTAHTGAADPHGNRVWAAGQFDPAGAAAAAVVTANAYTDAHSGGGGGGTIRTAKVRVSDDNLGGLPVAASWAVVVTSAGTPLQCSIPAAAGDRIRVVGRFMRAGSHFLDWVLLSSAGAISVYAATETGSPLGEGDPAEYPSLSFSYDPGPVMFTVGSGHIDGNGKVTIGLAHQGTGSGLVYAHSTYPWRVRLENIGPEPA